MKANLNLTSFIPDDFPKQSLRSRAGINVNSKGKFSINKNGKEITGFGAGSRVVMFQNEEPHTAIWFIKKDDSGWPLRDSRDAGLHFSAKFFAQMIFESFGHETETSFTFLMHDEPVEIDGEQYWILFDEDSSLDQFLKSIQEKNVNGHADREKGKRGRKRKENAFE